MPSLKLLVATIVTLGISACSSLDTNATDGAEAPVAPAAPIELQGSGFAIDGEFTAVDDWMESTTPGWYIIGVFGEGGSETSIFMSVNNDVDLSTPSYTLPKREVWLGMRSSNADLYKNYLGGGQPGGSSELNITLSDDETLLSVNGEVTLQAYDRQNQEFLDESIVVQFDVDEAVKPQPPQ